MSLEETSFFRHESVNATRPSGMILHGKRLWSAGLAISALYTLVTLVGLVGNITLMKTFWRVKSMRNAPNLLLSSLALGDVLLLLTCAPVDASRYLAERWLFGRLGCKLIPFIQLTSVGGSVFTLTVLSADRYKAVVKPMDVKSSDAKPKTGVTVAVIWMVSLALAIPEALFSDLHSFTVAGTNESFVTCAPYPHTGDLHPKIHSMFSFLIFYIIPLLIISIYYIFIAKTLSRSDTNMLVQDHVHIRRQVESRKRLAKTVLVFVGLFAICWLPSHALYLYRSYHYAEVDTSMAHFVSSVCARILAFANSCLNPYALYLLSGSFRRQFNRQLCCCCPPTTQSTASKTSAQTVTLSLMNANHLAHKESV